MSLRASSSEGRVLDDLRETATGRKLPPGGRGRAGPLRVAGRETGGDIRERALPPDSSGREHYRLWPDWGLEAGWRRVPPAKESLWLSWAHVILLHAAVLLSLQVCDTTLKRGETMEASGHVTSER